MTPGDDPRVLPLDYATEAGFESRASIYRAGESPDVFGMLIELLRERDPDRVLEVGCGPGRFAARVGTELGCELRAIDSSPRMVELARAKGVAADVADVQGLPFADGEFDIVVAAWMLFHVADLDRGLEEIARVLRPGGELIAVTNGAQHLRELWALVGEEANRTSFSAENGAGLLERHFASVDAIPIHGSVVFPDREAASRYVAASVIRSHLADGVPELAQPLRATTHNCIFRARSRITAC